MALEGGDVPSGDAPEEDLRIGMKTVGKSSTVFYFYI
jgi:hypothetical protein